MVVKDIQLYSISIEKKSANPAGADPVGACFLSHMGSFCRKTEYRRCQVPICRRILTTPPPCLVPRSGLRSVLCSQLHTFQLIGRKPEPVSSPGTRSGSRPPHGSGANTHKQKPPGAVKPSGGSFTQSCSDRRAVPACIYRSCCGCTLPTSCTRGLQGCRQSPGSVSE